MAIANVAALKQVVSQHESAPLNDVVKAINIKLRLADQNDNAATNHRQEAGAMLDALRRRVEADGQEWWKFAKGHFDRERKELEKLMHYVPPREIMKTAIAARPELMRNSDREIAREYGVSDKTVAKMRKEPTAENSAVEKRILKSMIDRGRANRDENAQG